MDKNTCDFSGWATRNNLRCSDGRTIMQNAFQDNDGNVVPLVWNHQHNESQNVLGHALLENRDDGVYSYCWFNETESGQNAKILVQHGDVQSLSIYANNLTQDGGNVKHGTIREVSLVLAGANPGAKIVNVMSHGDGSEEEADGCIIRTGDELVIAHADNCGTSEKPGTTTEKKEKEPMGNKTVGEVLETFNEEQKAAMMMVLEEALKKQKNGEKADESEDNPKEEKEMKQNAFDQNTDKNVINHSAMTSVISDAKRYGSMKESFEAHMDDFVMHDGASADTLTVAPGRGTTYGINNVDYLYPDAQNLAKTPDFYKRETSWVSKVMNGVHHTPFSRIKSMYADITADAARAKGYITGHKKTEEVIVALKRSTTPTTIYKKQKMDRDDIVDITDFDVVAWLKGEMRIMLDEEIARAILIGDGRLASSEDKISETNIRPIWTDDDTYTIKSTVTGDPTASTSNARENFAKEVIKAAVYARIQYKGSGNPVFFTTEERLTDMLLLEDGIGHRLYKSESELATAMRVSSIVTVPVMENVKRAVSGVDHYLVGLIVNLNDYNVGADKGGAVNMFEDFDIDYNQEKYLIETRCSGALVKPKAAIALEFTKTTVSNDQ